MFPSFSPITEELQPEFHNPEWLEKAIIYEIYPQSFYDTNGDGIGDLPGVIAKLDYIKSLGANAIWLNPCFESPFGDAGYDVADFFKVAPRYGTNEDLYRLFLLREQPPNDSGALHLREDLTQRRRLRRLAQHSVQVELRVGRRIGRHQ